MTLKETFEKLKQENHPLLNKPCKTMYEIPFSPCYFFFFESFDSIKDAVEKYSRAECEFRINEGGSLVFVLEFPRKIPKTY